MSGNNTEGSSEARVHFYDENLRDIPTKPLSQDESLFTSGISLEWLRMLPSVRGSVDVVASRTDILHGSKVLTRLPCNVVRENGPKSIKA